jgi:eukaryotic-like serine/threonine-protein kinase
MTGRSASWSSEDSRDFLQERISLFARTNFFILGFFFLAGWLVAILWTPNTLIRGLPLTPSYLFEAGTITVYLLMWLATRGGPLPGSVLRTIDAAGICLAAWGLLGMCSFLPAQVRPDLIAVIALMGVLLYRAALIPSEPQRTAWISVSAIGPLPFMTYAIYTRQPSATPPPMAHAAYAFLFAGLTVLLSTVVSKIIYGLRQTIREARRLGPYTLVEKIGEGGMGAVYRAQHALLRRPTAIKILPPERAGQIDLARFEREVQMTSQLTSPHTVSIYDYGRTPDGLFYYAMEYLDGIDLDELVRRDGPMPPGRVVMVLRQVCEALGEAHRVGLIHRDIKPANILLCERGGKPDVAKVVDFGLVKSLTGAEPGVTLENMVPGTPHYMSPESLRSPEGIDARSDLYALGATAYFLLTGKPVFEGPVAEIFAKHLKDRPVPPSVRAGKAIPASLEALVLSALAKTPDERPESADAFGAALLACDEAPAWTSAEASSWWKERGARIKAARSGADDIPPASRTLEVGRA